MAGRAASATVKEAGALPRRRVSGPWSVEGAPAERRSVSEYTVVGAFDDREVKRVLGLGAREEPLCLMPLGRAR